MKIYWFEIVGEDSILCGEEFFVEEENLNLAKMVVNEYFEGEEIVCHGTISEFEAEMMGLDTY